MKKTTTESPARGQMDAEEQAFWSHLEANPSDSVARLVFADWLQERGDQRAQGMRALGRLGKWAGEWDSQEMGRTGGGLWFWQCNADVLGDYDDSLPDAHSCLQWPKWWLHFRKRDSKQDRRSVIESAAALAWLDLTQEERDAICKLD